VKICIKLYTIIYGGKIEPIKDMEMQFTALLVSL